MDTLDASAIESFLHGQVECWNLGDREGFFNHYRSVSPNGLVIEYVGRPAMDGFAVLEGMWEQQNGEFYVDVEEAIICANEAACRHNNIKRQGAGVIKTIELYKFENGKTTVRYFIKT